MITACVVHDSRQSDVTDIYDPSLIVRKFHGIFIPEKLWFSTDNQAIKKNITQIVRFSRNNSLDAIFIEIPNDFGSVIYRPDNDFNPLKTLIKEAHQNGIEVYAAIDLFTTKGIPDAINPLSQRSPLTHIADPKIKTFLKKRFNCLTTGYDLDGIHFIISSGSGRSNSYLVGENSSYSAFSDVIENLLVSSMLIKPYLVNSISVDVNDFWSNHEILNLLGKNIIDFVVPVINPDTGFDYIDFSSRIQNSGFSEYSSCIFPGHRIQDVMEGDSKKPFPDKIAGMVFYPEKINSEIKYPYYIENDSLYNDEIHVNLKRTEADQIFGLDLSEIRFNGKLKDSIVLVNPGKKIKIPDSENWIGIILPDKPDSLVIYQDNDSLGISTLFWRTPFNYLISPEGDAKREKPWLEFRQIPDRITEKGEFHMLCRTEYPATAWIESDTVKVYKTGIFFKKIQLDKGTNRIKAGIMMPDSSKSIYVREFYYSEPEEIYSDDELWIEEKSITPVMEMQVLPEDKIHISFRGSKGKTGYILDEQGDKRIQCSRVDYIDHSIYSASLLAGNWETGIWHRPILLLKDTAAGHMHTSINLPARASFRTFISDQFPYVKTNRDYVRLTYTMGQVRLGGPIRAELPEGIILKTNGKFGDQYRIFLNDLETGYVDESAVEIMPESYDRDSYYISSLSCGPGEEKDLLTIPYSNNIPYAVFPEPEQKRIRIKLYGARTSSTWISHRHGRKVINNVTWSQPTDDTYEIIINLYTDRIWGYSLQREESSLVFRINHPPEVSGDPDLPLSGLKIAIEAGHGGMSFGAMGLSGLLEKDINLDLARKVEKILLEKGAEVLQIREKDTTMSLIDKRDIAIQSGADLLISIHANAAGTRGGFLRVDGTSTYYNNPFWSEFAEVMYNNLLELELDEFGVVGSFNYTVIRVSEMPSILVEQAFMTHAEDEEKLADEVFRQKMAEKIYRGIIDYISNKRE